MIQLIKKNNLLILGIILQVTYFTQVYPYIHFHHTHNENDLQIIVSSHPINHNSESHPDQHSGDHHNSSEHIIGDWNYINPGTRQPLEFTTNLLWINNIVLREKPEQVTIIQKETIYLPPPQIFQSSDLSRGPPYQS